MASIQSADVQTRPTEFLDFTSVTLDEFQQLVPPFEAAFHAHMAAWRLDGKPRTARQFAVYKTCPLPTPEDRLFFLLTYLKTYPLQVVQGRLFGMVQGKANQWIHVLLPVLLGALRARGDAPARSLTALAQRLGVSEADAATVVTPLEEASAPLAAAPPVDPRWRRSPSTPHRGEDRRRRRARSTERARRSRGPCGVSAPHSRWRLLRQSAPLRGRGGARTHRQGNGYRPSSRRYRCTALRQRHAAPQR